MRSGNGKCRIRSGKGAGESTTKTMMGSVPTRVGSSSMVAGHTPGIISREPVVKSESMAEFVIRVEKASNLIRSYGRVFRVGEVGQAT